MKYIIVVVLSALLILNAQHINKSAAQGTHQPGEPITAEIAPIALSKLQMKTYTTYTAAKVISSHEALMLRAGIPESEWNATDYIVRHESSWNPSAVNPSTGAYGLCQAYPASKMASVGRDYKTNPVTQLKWCHQYAKDRYGSWWSAFAFWRGNQWW